MRWQDRRRSARVEDRRGARPAKAGVGGVGMLVILAVLWLMGADPRQLLQMLVSQSGSLTEMIPGSGAPPSAEENELKEFVSVVLADTEDVWNALLPELGRNYEEPNLVLFSGSVRSACGFAGSSVGPFYCPGDHKVYIDLGFYQEMKTRFKAPGDFAQAYVIAHEVGHHVQNLLGISDKVHAARGRVDQTEYNQLSVRLELQADYFAGVWAHHAEQTKSILEEGDLEEAINAASAIGDDRLQRESSGTVVPDSFTHGTSAQRVRWFRKGFESGDPRGGNTFNLPYAEL